MVADRHIGIHAFRSGLHGVAAHNHLQKFIKHGHFLVIVPIILLTGFIAGIVAVLKMRDTPLD